MAYTMYTPLNVWLDPASVTDVVAYIQNYLSENTIYSEEEIETLIHDYLEAHPELIGGVQSVNGKTGTVVLSASDINTANNTTIQAVINSLSADISAIVQSVTNEATARSNADTELSGRITTNATGITNEATARANADAALGNRITALQGAVGSPLVAATASAMTDTSKIYVYTGSETGYTIGNWYYYNGSAWTSGGVYNSTAINTDTTLTVAGMAADAKATGDGLNDLKSAFDDCFYASTGKNLVNSADFVSGYLKSDGTLAQYSDWMTTGYCDVKGLNNIVASRSLVGDTSGRRYTLSLFFLCYYTENKTFIEQNNTSDNTIAVPNNVAFVRFSFHLNSDENIMLESGTVPTMPYEPYTEGFKLYEFSSPLIWKGKKWAAIGDSLTEVNTRTTMHYHDYIAQKTGITVINMGVSGTGYARGQDTDTAFYQRTSSVPTDADVVTIFGSFNDLGANIPIGTINDTGTTTIAGCINTTIDNLQTAIPLINLGIVAPTPWAGQQPTTSGNAYEYVEMLKSICEHRSIPFLDLWRCSNLRPWDSAFRAVAYSKDDGNGTHPDENGHALIAPHFEAFLDSLLLH